MSTYTKCAALALGLCLSLSAQAHRGWMLPSATVLSGEAPWITVDAAISNDLFYFEHNPMRLDHLQISAPDGSPLQAQNRSTGKYRSSFDVQLSQAGTYKFAVINEALFANYTLNGEAKRWRGSMENLSKEVPADAQALQITQSQGRVEVFVTAGKPTATVLQPSGAGLELAAITHPNDLFAGEPASFRLLLDGKPAADVKVAIIPGGIRYRDQLNDINTSTDSEGKFTVTWPHPGMYWLGASVQDDKASMKGAKRRASYAATLEVMPQ